MHPWVRMEIYLWENHRRLQRESKLDLWNDPSYQALRQSQIDQGKVIGQIMLGVAILVGISYFLFP